MSDTLLGVIIGGALTFLGGILTELWRERLAHTRRKEEQRRALLTSGQTELTSMMEMALDLFQQAATWSNQEYRTKWIEMHKSQLRAYVLLDVLDSANVRELVVAFSLTVPDVDPGLVKQMNLKDALPRMTNAFQDAQSAITKLLQDEQ